MTHEEAHNRGGLEQAADDFNSAKFELGQALEVIRPLQEKVQQCAIALETELENNIGKKIEIDGDVTTVIEDGESIDLIDFDELSVLGRPDPMPVKDHYIISHVREGIPGYRYVLVERNPREILVIDIRSIRSIKLLDPDT